MNVVLYITMAVMTVLSLIILYSDSTRMKIKFLWLFLFNLAGFLGVVVGKTVGGSFEPYYLIFIPLGIGLYFLNNRLPHRILGKGDLDILFGTLSLFIPATIETFSQVHPGMKNPELVNLLQFQSLILDMMVFFVIGSVIALLIGIVRYFYAKIKERKRIKGLQYEVLADLSVKDKKKFRKLGIPASSVYLLPYIYLVYYVLTMFR